jgi:TonB family protein
MANLAQMSQKERMSGWQQTGALLLATVGALLFQSTRPAQASENVPAHPSVDRSGEIPAANKSTLTLATDLGSVSIRALPANTPPVVRYTVHIETDAQEPFAHALLEKYVLNARATPAGVTLNGSLPALRTSASRNAQFWVQFIVYVPPNFGAEISTGAGDIEASDLGGGVRLSTEGGNIHTGKIGFYRPQASTPDRPAGKLETQGGHITVLDVAGDLDAYTAGGHIQAGNVSGSAKLRTGGGHIRVGKVQGKAQLETDGGNITVGEAGAFVMVRTGGGQIDFGEVRGSVHAQTAGGGIRVMYVNGPMEVETSGGSVCLTRVASSIRAATGNGAIRAWITPDSSDSPYPVRLPGASQLSSSTGDIVVYLPRNLVATIDAIVDNGGPQRIEYDPSLPLSVQTHPGGMTQVLGSLNGGGELLKLHSSEGKIRLQYLDAETGLRQSLLEEQKARLEEKLSGVNYPLPQPPPLPEMGAQPAVNPGEKTDWADEWIKWFELKFLGGFHEDPEEFKKRLVASPAPEYPPLARRAGLQGMVRLQVRAKPDGSVVVEKVLEGDPTLTDAAVAALRQWHARPGSVGGKKVDVITTVSFNFQLR